MTGFLQTGDVHVGECRHLPGYLARHKSLLEQMITTALHRKLPLIISGDLFHAKNTTHQERTLVAWFLGELERNLIPSIVTSGNHDHLSGEFTQLHMFEHMPFKHVKIIPWEPKVTRIGEIAFICIPWRGYSTEEIEATVLRLYPETQTPDVKYRVVLLHECILGSKFDNGKLAPKGCKIPKMDGINYWAVGDLHSFQPTNVPNGFYAGAPAQFKSDDVPGKGMLEVDLDNPTKPIVIPLVSKEIRVVNSYAEVKDDAYYIVEGDMDDVLKANRDTNVIRSEWTKRDIGVFEYKKIGIYEGLPEFLSTKGIPVEQQEFAVQWVKKVLNLEGAAA